VGSLTAGLPASGIQDDVWIRQLVSLPTQARRSAAALGRRIGLSAERVAEVELAVTEAAVNLNKHAVDGALLLRLSGGEECRSVELLVLDHGPGMADVAAARRDGVSSAGTLGIGLGAVERMADSFEVRSFAGRGTVLVARFRPRGSKAEPVENCPEPAVVGLTRPLSGEQLCGDAWAARMVPAVDIVDTSTRADAAADTKAGAGARAPAGQGPTLLVMLCDGLGHGPLAARASEQAVADFHRAPGADPVEILAGLHRALAGTRGGAAAVAAIDVHARRVRYCGVGNISGFVVTDERRSSLLSAPGIVGHHLPRLRAFDADLPDDARIVLHSDGLTERWNPATMPGLFHSSGTVIAAHLLREAGVRRDDASVVVIDAAAVGGRP
jgi:anti-sigma regulatory factor (Ser/Thr protein kinase)/serine/threonine protein phosphatase PrpC